MSAQELGALSGRAGTSLCGTSAAAGPATLDRRFPDWPAHLNAEVEKARAKPFDWRTHNCATFAADCVEAQTGVSLHGHFAHMMTTGRRAVLFAADLDLHVDAILGAERRVPLPYLQRGDVVLLRSAAGPVLGICLGVTAAAAGPQGLAFLPMREALCGWRI